MMMSDIVEEMGGYLGDGSEIEEAMNPEPNTPVQSDAGDVQRKLPKLDPLLMKIARIVNDIQIAYSDRIKAGDEVLSSFGIKELRQLIQTSEQEAYKKGYIDGQLGK